MKKEDIKKLFQGGTWFGQVSEEKVKAMEILLNVKFPQDYRAFIKYFGNGIKKGTEIFGYHPNIHADENIIGLNVRMRRNYYPFMQATNLLFFSETGDGRYVAFDTKDGWKVKVVVRNKSKQGFKTTIIAKSFLDFLFKKFGGEE